MRSLLHAFALAAGGSLLIGAIGCSGTHTGAPQGDFAGRVAIDGGRHLYLQCQGTGSPTVVLEAGLRVRSDYWSQNNVGPPSMSVLPGVAKFTRVCTYDRPGTVIGERLEERSRSDPVPMPRSAMSAVRDLHGLAQAAHIQRPLVLVGHSTGGLLVRLYARTYPDDVAGLVLLDALPDGLQRHMTAAQYALFLRLNTQKDHGMGSYRDYESIPFDQAFTDLHRLEAAGPLKPMPLVIVSRGLAVNLPPDSVPPGFPSALERAWRIEQAGLVKLVPHATHIIAKRSDHFMMFSEPDLVIRVIRDVIEAVRKAG